jgi:hypothetical protein
MYFFWQPGRKENFFVFGLILRKQAKNEEVENVLLCVQYLLTSLF